jgi:hypothetical protein
MRIFRAPAFLIVMVLSASSSAAEYSSIKQLLLAAIDASDGRASGFILGQIAEKFKRTTGSSAPILAEVSTIKSFKQEGCKRLNVRLTQSGVATSDRQDCRLRDRLRFEPLSGWQPADRRDGPGASRESA